MSQSFPPPHRDDTGREHGGRYEAVDVDGTTRTVWVPAGKAKAPPDWDNWLNRGLVTGTVLFVCAALAWSVVAIGALLSMQAPEPLAYVVGGLFDLGWILCAGYEFQLRYRPSRQVLPRRAGWALLAVSVAVVFTHGLIAAGPVVATVGALIPVLAKVLWTIRVHIGRRDLNPITQAVLDQDLDEMDRMAVVLGARRQFARVESRARRELAALGLPFGTLAISSGTPSRTVLRAVPDGQDSAGGGEDELTRAARKIIGDGPVPSRAVLQARLREDGYRIGTDRAQRLVLALRDAARDTPDTGTGT